MHQNLSASNTTPTTPEDRLLTTQQTGVMEKDCNENKLLHQRELIPRTVGDCCYV